jgi:HEPN domain-containing protein
MRTPEQAKWDFVQQWLNKAHQDLRAAQVILAGDFEDYGNVGFHAQQAAEKFIKALLVRHQIEFPKSHDIAVLRKLVARVDQDLADRLAAADVLTPYGVEFRYPGEPPLSRDQGRHALKLGEQAREAVLAHLKSYLDAGRHAGGNTEGKK